MTERPSIETPVQRPEVAALLRDCAPRVERLAARLLGQDAQDGMQEVMATAVAALPSFRRRAQLTTWFHRLAVRVLCRCRARLQRRSAREFAGDDLDATLPPTVLRDRSELPFERAAAAELRLRVLTALDQLSPPLRDVLVLRLEDLSYAELAEALDVPIGTVKSRMAAAMVQLAIQLQRRTPERP